ncbi:MAG: ribosome recycling factor [Candidatus Andersenbacteria bacterium]
MPFSTVKPQFESAKQEALEWFQKEIAGLRTGRVKPDLVDSIPVEAYGARSPLKSLASVSSSDARTLVISPFDKGVISDIEKAVTNANLGVNPAVDGSIIRLAFPSLTEESRKQTLKVLHAKAEDTRVRLRQARDEALKTLKEEKEKSDITEDDFYDGKKDLDELIGKANGDIDGIIKKKEEEITTI